MEPTDFDCDCTQEDKDSLVGGVEVCMWSEFVDATNFLPRMWPRASAVAERGWSTQNTTDTDDAYQRLQEWRCKLMQRGIPAEPIMNGGAPQSGGVAAASDSFCTQEWQFDYNQPWTH